MVLIIYGCGYLMIRQDDSGYSPEKGFAICNIPLQMAKRLKAAGMKLLLDFHYSDNWADPGKQYQTCSMERFII